MEYGCAAVSSRVMAIGGLGNAGGVMLEHRAVAGLTESVMGFVDDALG